MHVATRPTLLAFGAALALTFAAGGVQAAPRSFITLTDDGSLAGKITSPDPITHEVLKQFDKTGTHRPDVISVWTNFKMDQNAIETLFDPLGNDVTGIGLDNEYGGDGTLTSNIGAPTRAILLHNDFTELDARAKRQGAPTEGFARYLFLLELTHLWGPAVRIPVPDGGAADGGVAPTKDELIGFPFHWSFWMDAKGSPAGGNAWKDNGDGTYTASGQKPSTVRYSMLDLYVMGLADASEVQPFGVLEGAKVTTGQTDPFSGGAFTQQSFPWFGATPLTVTATRRTITIEDVIATNGTRTPAKTTKPLTLGVVLMLAKGTKPEDVAAIEAAFAPVADSLAPAFADATGGRGSLTVITSATDDAGAPAVDADAGALADSPTPTSGGCSAGTGGPTGAGALCAVLLGLAAALLVTRARRSS
jgi:hypothetical protein